MLLLKLTVSLLAIVFSNVSNSQTLSDCKNLQLPMDVVVNACKSIVNNNIGTDKEIAFAARRLGLILPLIDKRSNNSSEIIGYFLIAARRGSSESYSHIAQLYRQGYRDLKVDYGRALHYYGLDSNLSLEKLKGLGDMYLHGLGLEKDIKRGLLALRIAANDYPNDTESRSKLCQIYLDQKYGSVDLIKAYFWCSSVVEIETFPALKSFYEDKVWSISKNLSIPQLEEGNRLIKKCKETTIAVCFFNEGNF